MQSRGPEPGATSLCPGLPPAMLSTQGFREGTSTKVTLAGVRATDFISSAVHRWELGGCTTFPDQVHP